MWIFMLTGATCRCFILKYMKMSLSFMHMIYVLLFGKLHVYGFYITLVGVIIRITMEIKIRYTYPVYSMGCVAVLSLLTTK